MKTSLAIKRVSRTTARNSFLINQFATPGLGSLMAGRRVAGCGQLLLAVAGFAMVMGWFVLLAIHFYHQITGDDSPGQSAAWLAEAGGLTFGAAWLWALVTSISLLREARENESQSSPQPPKLS